MQAQQPLNAGGAAGERCSVLENPLEAVGQAKFRRDQTLRMYGSSCGPVTAVRNPASGTWFLCVTWVVLTSLIISGNVTGSYRSCTNYTNTPFISLEYYINDAIGKQYTFVSYYTYCVLHYVVVEKVLMASGLTGRCCSHGQTVEALTRIGLHKFTCHISCTAPVSVQCMSARYIGLLTTC